MLAVEYIVQQAEVLVGFEARGGNPNLWFVSKDFQPEDAAAIQLTADAIREGRFSPEAWAAGNATIAAVLAQVTPLSHVVAGGDLGRFWDGVWSPEPSTAPASSSVAPPSAASRGDLF